MLLLALLHNGIDAVTSDVKTFWGRRDKQLPDGTEILVRYSPAATPSVTQ
jgi:hypothetical protein